MRRRKMNEISGDQTPDLALVYRRAVIDQQPLKEWQGKNGARRAAKQQRREREPRRDQARRRRIHRNPPPRTAASTSIEASNAPPPLYPLEACTLNSVGRSLTLSRNAESCSSRFTIISLAALSKPDSLSARCCSLRFTGVAEPLTRLVPGARKSILRLGMSYTTASSMVCVSFFSPLTRYAPTIVQ